MSDDIREEQWLADIRSAARGEATTYDLEPIIRKEFYYADIITALKNGGGGGGGTSDYSQLSNKPQINSTELSGDKSSSDLGLQGTIDSTHKLDADLVDDTSATNKFTNATEKAKVARIIMDSTETTNVYVQATQPTGTIPEGSIWFNTGVVNP